MKGNLPVYGLKEFLPEAQRSLEVYVNDLSEHLAGHRFVNVPHSHQTYICVFFTSGEGTHQVDFETFDVLPGDIFLLVPGQVHNWTLSPDTGGYVFFHSSSFYQEYFRDHPLEGFPFFRFSSNYPRVRLQKEMIPVISGWFGTLLKEYHNATEFGAFRMALLINLIYIDLARVYRNPAEGSVNEKQNRAGKLTALVDKHFVSIKSPAYYAEMMNMTLRHLNRLCMQSLGKTTGDIIKERIILEAKRLLIYRQETVSEIAYALGFEDGAYFVRFFRTHTGLSPGRFRADRQHRLLGSRFTPPKGPA